MAKKQTTGTILIFIVLGFLLLTQTNLLDLRGFSTATTTLESNESVLSYTCPSGSGIFCNIQGILECNQAKEELKVVFRTNAVNGDYRNKQIRVEDRNKDPEGNIFPYDYNSIKTTTSQPPTTKLLEFKTPEGYVIRDFFGDKRSLDIYDDKGNIFVFKTADSSPIPATTTPREPYTSNNQEVLGGTSAFAFNCNGQLTVETPLGGVVTENLAYNGPSSGKDISNFYRLGSGDTANINGNDRAIIKYDVLRSVESCQANICTPDGTGIIECIDNKQQAPTQCSSGVCIDDNSGVRCDDPISISQAIFIDSDNDVVTGYEPGEQIRFRASFRTDSSSVNSITVRASLQYATGEVVDPGATRVISLSQNTFKTNEWTFSPVTNNDKYRVVLDITYSGDKKVTPKPQYDFTVSQPLDLFIAVKSGVTDGSLLYSGYPIVIELRTGKSGQAEAITSYDLSVIQGNTRFNNPQPNPLNGVVDTINGVQVYSFTYNSPLSLKPLDLVVNAQVDKTGVESLPIERRFPLNVPTIQAEFTNDENFGDQISLGKHTLTFETKDPFNNFIETNNILKVTIDQAPQDISNLIKGENGKYSFTFDFQKEKGHIFELTSNHPDFVSTTIPSKNLNIRADGTNPFQCVENTDCNSGEFCDTNGSCKDNPETPFFNFFTIFLIVGIVVLIIIVIRVRKKKTVSPSITGL